MKLSTFLFSAMLFLGLNTEVQSAESLNLKDITNGVYSPHYIYGVTPMNDGETYTQLSNNTLVVW